MVSDCQPADAPTETATLMLGKIAAAGEMARAGCCRHGLANLSSEAGKIAPIDCQVPDEKLQNGNLSNLSAVFDTAGQSGAGDGAIAPLLHLQ
jgi:hypothetical protein